MSRSIFSFQIRLYPGLLIFPVLFFFSQCSSFPFPWRSGPGPAFALVNFGSPVRGISSKELQGILLGEIKNFKQIGGSDLPLRLFVDARLLPSLRTRFPGQDFKTVSLGENPYLAADPSFFGIGDISTLWPGYRALYIDRCLPWGKLEDDYSLDDSARYSFRLDSAASDDDSPYITIVQTGVTAMTRAFHRVAESYADPDEPIRFVRNITSGADIAMTSNEVSFMENCQPSVGLRFCSPDKLFPLFRHLGIDIVELTGNHNNDFGPEANVRTMNMFDSEGISYFGGNRNQHTAESVLYKNFKKTRFAFVGFNEPGPAYAWAGETTAGSARLEEGLFLRLIKEAAQSADVIFVSIQSTNENDEVPAQSQKNYFHLAAQNGGDIMVSSSAHHLMGMEFFEGKFISYGFGNFLFDQMHTLRHRLGVIARHIFFGGRHVQTELIPYTIYNASQPRVASGEEAAAILQEAVKYSIGPYFGR